MQALHITFMELDPYKAYHQIETVCNSMPGCKLFSFTWEVPDDMGFAIVLVKDVSVACAVMAHFKDADAYYIKPTKYMQHQLK